MKTPEQAATLQVLTELLNQMDERQLHKAARFLQLFIGQRMPYEEAVAAVKAEFPPKV